MDKKEKGGVGKGIYELLWGSSEVPTNRTITFLLSNLSYIILGIIIILRDTGQVYDIDRATRAWILILVGFVSTIFHSNQIAHGNDDHRTGVFHFTDIAVAVLAFVFSIVVRGVGNIPSSVYVLVLASLPFYLYNGRYYWLSHSIWHFISAVILFIILDY